jgi:hypothetical protein
MARWYMAGYVLVLTFAVVTAFRTRFDSGFLWPMVTSVFALIITSVVVQADSPWRSDEFWPTRPLEWSAVVAAKFLFSAVAIGGLAMTAQGAILLSGYDVTAPDLARSLSQTALAFAGTLITSLVVATLTRNLRGAVLVFILQFIISYFIWLSIASSWATDSVRVSHIPLIRLALLLGFLAPLAVTVVVYYTRNWGYGAALGLIVLLLIPSLGFTVRADVSVDPNRSGYTRAISDTPPALRAASLELVPGTGRQFDNGLYRIDARLSGGSDLIVYSLVSGELEFQLRNDSIVFATLGRDVQLGVPPVAEGLRWRSVRGWKPPQHETHTLEVTLKPEQQRQLSAGISRIVLHGQLRVFEPTILATIPFVAGSIAVNAGHRFELVNVSNVDGKFVLIVSSVVHTEGLYRRPETAWLPEYALVNRQRGEALQIDNRGESSGTLGLVVISNEMSQRRTRTTAQPTQLALPDPTWFEGAQLLRIVWRDRGRYAVSAACNSC